MRYFGQRNYRAAGQPPRRFTARQNRLAELSHRWGCAGDHLGSQQIRVTETPFTSRAHVKSCHKLSSLQHSTGLRSLGCGFFFPLSGPIEF